MASHDELSDSPPSSGAHPKLGPEPSRAFVIDHGIHNATHGSLTACDGLGMDPDDLDCFYDLQPEDLVDHTANCSLAILNGDADAVLRNWREAQEIHPSWTTEQVYRCLAPGTVCDQDRRTDDAIDLADLEEEEQSEVEPTEGVEVEPEVELGADPGYETDSAQEAIGESHAAAGALCYVLTLPWISIKWFGPWLSVVSRVPIRDILEACAVALVVPPTSLFHVGRSVFTDVLDIIRDLSRDDALAVIDDFQRLLCDADYTNCSVMIKDAASCLYGTLVLLYDAFRYRTDKELTHLRRITVHVEFRALKLMHASLAICPTADPHHQSSTDTSYTGDRTCSG